MFKRLAHSRLCSNVLFIPTGMLAGVVGPGGAVLERTASMDNVLDTSRTAKYDHNEYKKIKQVSFSTALYDDLRRVQDRHNYSK